MPASSAGLRRAAAPRRPRRSPAAPPCGRRRPRRSRPSRRRSGRRARRRRRRAARGCAASPCCAHMCGFIAGASKIFLSVASSTAEARSSARPLAIFAIRSAVAGATTMMFGSRASRIWPTSNSLLRVEQIGIRMLAGERADRQRRDEFLRRLRHHHAHRDAALAQAADQVERFVGGDAAADDEQDALGRRSAASRCGLRLSALGDRDERVARRPRRCAGWCGPRPRPSGRSCAARSRSRFFSFSSSWRTVRLAMRPDPIAD